MNRVDYLHSRAVLLRKTAKAIDIRSIRDRILALAEECVVLAKLIEKADTVRSPARSRSQQRTKGGPRQARRARG